MPTRRRRLHLYALGRAMCTWIPHEVPITHVSRRRSSRLGGRGRGCPRLFRDQSRGGIGSTMIRHIGESDNIRKRCRICTHHYTRWSAKCATETSFFCRAILRSSKPFADAGHARVLSTYRRRACRLIEIAFAVHEVAVGYCWC